MSQKKIKHQGKTTLGDCRLTQQSSVSWSSRQQSYHDDLCHLFTSVRVLIQVQNSLKGNFTNHLANILGGLENNVKNMMMSKMISSQYFKLMVTLEVRLHFFFIRVFFCYVKLELDITCTPLLLKYTSLPESVRGSSSSALLCDLSPHTILTLWIHTACTARSVEPSPQLPRDLARRASSFTCMKDTFLSSDYFI